MAATPTVGQEMGELDLAGLYTRLEDKGVSFRAGLDLLRLDGREAILRDAFSGQEVTVGPFDAVVLGGRQRAGKRSCGGAGGTRRRGSRGRLGERIAVDHGCDGRRCARGPARLEQTASATFQLFER